MTSNDLKQFGQLLDERFNAFGKDIRRFIDEKIGDSENRTISTLRKEFGDIVHDIILPQLDEKADKTDILRLESNVDRIERKLDNYSAQVYKNTDDINTLKQLPTISHDLASTKS